MNISFDQTEPIVDRILGDRYSDEMFYEVHQAFTYLLDSEPTIPESAYDNICRSLANTYRYAVKNTCERITYNANSIKRELSN